MCLILFALAPSPEVALVVIANRDERLDRPTDRLHPWPDGSGVFAGVDREAGGTWLGVQPARARFAAITNVRDPADLRPREPGERSRGTLVTRCLLAEDFARDLAVAARGESGLRGFNLLVMDAEGMYWASNRGGEPTRVARGVHGLSNALLDTPWPKVERGKALLAEALRPGLEPGLEALFAILHDEARPSDDALPDTGVGLALERALAPIHLSMPGYGTRSSTVFVARADGSATLVERSPAGEARFELRFRAPSSATDA